MLPQSLQEGFGPPASSEALDAMLKSLGYGLPDAYLGFLRHNDGYERCRWEPVHFWSSDEVVPKNHAYHVQEYLPQCLAIGTSGGDFGFLLDRSVSTDASLWPVRMVDLGLLTAETWYAVAETFAAWQSVDFRYEHLFDT